MSQVAYYLGCRLKMEKNDKDEDEDVKLTEAENIQESRAPREVQKIEVKRVPEDSPEECVITRSNSYGPTDSSQPHRDTSEITFEEDNIDSALVVESESSHDVVEDALIIVSDSQSDDEEEEERGPVPPRSLQESVEDEAPEESWDEGSSTLSVPPGTSASSESYRSNLHLLEEQKLDLTVDIARLKRTKKREKTKAHHAPGSAWS
ncbi:neuroblastoma breakpoint family member 10-like isoform X2 [Cebus imitator]|uniref:neuroblastoma breakpoint family member 10-like isoform X2 n=1 Tax=Cebus imitator TaxID=2715852 RepID=UPI00189A481F|nr:neuroblastoma breakpoint family member 10-like isoform X2 [Cebus imitator]